MFTGPYLGVWVVASERGTHGLHEVHRPLRQELALGCVMVHKGHTPTPRIQVQSIHHLRQTVCLTWYRLQVPLLTLCAELRNVFARRVHLTRGGEGYELLAVKSASSARHSLCAMYEHG